MVALGVAVWESRRAYRVLRYPALLSMKRRYTLLLALAIGIIGTLLSENFLHILITRVEFYMILVVGAASAGIVYFPKFLRRLGLHSLVIAVTLGLLMMPYLGFVLGKSDLFVKDALPEGLEVKELRVTILKQEFRKAGTDEWVTTMENRSMTLYVGRNWAWLGELNLPVGKYDRMRMWRRVEIDIKWDNNVISQNHPDWRVPSPDWDPHCIRSEDLGGGKYLITFLVDEFETADIAIDKPIAVNPDIGLDITLGEDGFPVKIAVHIFLPEPIGEIIEEWPLPERPKGLS
jgi:hypothetical protein